MIIKKQWNRLLCILLIICLTGCSIEQKGKEDLSVDYQKEIQRISRYESKLPKNYQWMDYKSKALSFDEFVFKKDSLGQYLPLIWEDKTFETFGIPAYVGDGRFGKDGEQEAVTAVAAVLSATLLGIDKSSQNGINYVSQISAFYSEEEQIILNNPKGSSETTSMWYLIYPAILFTQVSMLYPEEEILREQALTCINSWYEAYKIMNATKTFDYTGFNFKTMEPYKNNIWTEPDCIAGISLLLYYGYQLTGNKDYIKAGISGMEYVENYFGSPLYEALLYFAPTLMAIYNAEFGTNFDINGVMNDIFNGSSIPRGGWGSIVGDWGEYSVNGLMGSTTDGGGYAFAMNTFTAAYAMSSLVKYDTRYAKTMGTWLLNVVSNSRYFFPDETVKENQSVELSDKSEAFLEVSKGVVPYEGIRKSLNSKTPWFGGDPTVYGWAETDFSLYSGAHMGLLASIAEKSSVEGILKINLNTSDVSSEKNIVSFLYYNPYKEEKKIEYKKMGKGEVDLFNTVTREYIAKNVTDTINLKIGADEAVIVAELPADSTITKDGLAHYVDSMFVYADCVSANVTNYKNNDKVSKRFELHFDAASTIENDKIREIKIRYGEDEVVVTNSNSVKISSSDVGIGSKTFQFEVEMESGLRDQFELRLIVE